MKIIGIVGKAGVGKSTIVKTLHKEIVNCQKFNVDIFVSKLYKSNTFFKTMILYLCKTLDKNKVRQILIANPKMMKLAEMYVEKELKEKLEFLEEYYDTIIIDCANLHKFKSIKVDHWIEVICPEDIRISRLVERDGIEKANQLIELQKDLTYSELESKIVFDSVRGNINHLIERITNEFIL